MVKYCYLSFVLGQFALFAGIAVADDLVGSKDSFRAKVAPFLKTHCLACHGEKLHEGDLRLDRLSPDVAGGPHGKQWRSVLERMEAGEMPPEDAAQPTLAERKSIVLWLKTHVPRTDPQKTHWAFQPLTKPKGNSIDEFVHRQLKQRGFTPSPREEPQRLLRRVYLDLIGLPPSPQELRAFDEDPSPERLEAIVDQLLASPRYGERWGRHWLDLARYADSNGLHEDSDRPHAWRYRDYVIQSFNDDKPYGQFIREQLAGDEIAPQNPAAWIATGFCRNGPSNEENVAKAEVETYRLDQLDEMLATTCQVFLGQTLQCARCHNHKLEAFTQADYYRLLAVFDNSVAAYVPLNQQSVGKPDLRPVQPRSKRKPPKDPHLRALTNAGGKPRVMRILLKGNPATPGDEVAPNVPEVLNHFPARFAIENNAPTGRRTALANWIASAENPLTWRVMANRVWMHHFGKGLIGTPSNFGESGSRPTHPELLDWLACELRDNGGHLKPLHKQIVLSRTYQQSSRFRETAYQQDPENSLLWRYPPHRLEAEVIRDSVLFASGNLNLKMGGPGIKPQLPKELLVQSKRNQWPNIPKETSAHWRRSVYVYIKRQLPMPMLSLFDAPDASQSCAARFRSVTPTQALVLLNDEFINLQARYLAKRVLAEHPQEPERRMMDLVWALPIQPKQLAQAKAFTIKRELERQSQPEAKKLALADLAVVLFNASQFIYID